MIRLVPNSQSIFRNVNDILGRAVERSHIDKWQVGYSFDDESQMLLKKGLLQNWALHKGRKATWHSGVKLQTILDLSVLADLEKHPQVRRDFPHREDREMKD